MWSGWCDYSAVIRVTHSEKCVGLACTFFLKIIICSHHVILKLSMRPAVTIDYPSLSQLSLLRAPTLRPFGFVIRQWRLHLLHCETSRTRLVLSALRSTRVEYLHLIHAWVCLAVFVLFRLSLAVEILNLTFDRSIESQT